MADTTTPVYSFVLPEIDGSDGTWGTKLNANLTALDGLLSGSANLQNASFTGTASFGGSTGTSGQVLKSQGAGANAIWTDDSNTTYTAGSGLSLTGTEFANTAPDQTVVMNAGSGISVSGTYPTFTVTNSSPDQTVGLTGTGGTTISGTYPNFTINSTDNNTTYTAGTGLTLTSTEFSVTDNGIGALQLNVSGNGTSGQVLQSDGDGSFSWASTGTGGNETLAQTLALGAVTGGTDISVSSGDNIVMAANSTVDGRDVSVDGTKLDGIETGATADQTAAQILTAIKTVDGSGSGLDADTVDGVHASGLSRFYNDATLNSSTTTANLIAELIADYGAFSNNQVTLKCSWSYAGNSDLVTGDATVGTIELAGCLVEAWGGTYKHIRITRPTTGTGGATICVYNDQGSDYSPGWREIWTSQTDGSGSGLDADTLDGVNGASYLRSDATDYINGVLYARADIRNEDAYRDHGAYGHYVSSKTNHIWSMGSSYRSSASGANFGTLYGFGYKHTNNSTGGTMAGSHQAVWCHNGTPKAALGTGIWTSGNVTAYSDIRVKENLKVIPNALDKVMQLNGYTYDRTDLSPATAEEEDITYAHNPTGRHVGVIAQEVLKVLPEAVTGGPNSMDGTDDDHYSVAYGNMVALLIEAVKELKAEVEELKGNA